MAIYSTIQKPVRNEQLSIGVSNVKVSDAKNDANERTTILIRNISPNATDIITINLGNSISTNNNGIVLRQFESFSDSSDNGYQCYQGTINGICATATGLISIMER